MEFFQDASGIQNASGADEKVTPGWASHALGASMVKRLTPYLASLHWGTAALRPASFRHRKGRPRDLHTHWVLPR